jgi:gallate decarboxylase subunit D
MAYWNVSASNGKFAVSAEVLEMGDDCLVAVWGGTRPHIGAVGMGQVRPSLRDPNKSSATSSVFTFVGHKEDSVAKWLAEELSRRLKRNTVVAAGIHWDNLSEDDISAITGLCRDILEKILERMASAKD